MACLKEYIARLDEDITVLETATSYVSKIVSSQDEVDSSLTMLQTYYEATVNASDELISEFHKLNDGAVGAATRIKTTIYKILKFGRN